MICLNNLINQTNVHGLGHFLDFVTYHTIFFHTYTCILDVAIVNLVMKLRRMHGYDVSLLDTF
jgi:hypothetical protein